MRYFEKVSLHEAMNYMCEKDYNEISLPYRSTKFAAGYDFVAPYDFCLKSKKSIKIATGLKAFMENDEFLEIVVRSSVGIKNNVRLCNQVGIIDKDYYNNTNNEGHIFIALMNESESDWIVKKGERIAQGIFLKYLIVDNEKEILRVRNSGIGSTN